MLKAATYSNGSEVLKVSLEKVEVLLKSDEPLNFPRTIQLAGNRLMLPYRRGGHGGAESRWSACSGSAAATRGPYSI